MTPMNNVKVLLRLPVPEGRPGDSVVVPAQRAQLLVDSGYATFIEVVDQTAEDTLDAVATEARDDDATEPAPSVGPAIHLPAKSARKEKWEEVAASLGIATDDMNKDEVIEAVTDAVG